MKTFEGAPRRLIALKAENDCGKMRFSQFLTDDIKCANYTHRRKKRLFRYYGKLDCSEKCQDIIMRMIVRPHINSQQACTVQINEIT